MLESTAVNRFVLDNRPEIRSPLSIRLKNSIEVDQDSARSLGQELGKVYKANYTEIAELGVFLDHLVRKDLKAPLEVEANQPLKLDQGLNVQLSEDPVTLIEVARKALLSLVLNQSSLLSDFLDGLITGADLSGRVESNDLIKHLNLYKEIVPPDTTNYLEALPIFFNPKADIDWIKAKPSIGIEGKAIEASIRGRPKLNVNIYQRDDLHGKRWQLNFSMARYGMTTSLFYNVSTKFNELIEAKFRELYPD